jgi:general secretion pathway protein F
MPNYRYSGVNDKGKNVSGVIDAENEKAARAKLRRTSIFPTTLGEEGKGGGGFSLNANVDVGKYFQRVTVEDLALMTRQLGSLLQAGIPLVEALAALSDQTENPKLRSAVATIREKVTEGSKLSDAMKAYPKIFDTLYINMINAGEASGALELVLQRLGDFTESQARLTQRVKSAMTYPILMTVVGGSLMIMLLTFVVPKITKRLVGMGKDLPLPTKLLMGVSDTLIGYWYIFLILGVAIFFFTRRFLRSPKGKEWFDRKILKAPVIGKLTRLVAISRFSRTLGTLLASGVPMLNAMDIVRNIITNTVMRQAIETTRDAVKEGASISETLKRTGEFPPLVIHMLSVGEKTGELEKMLDRVADNYDRQVDNTIGALTSLLEPLMIVVMAAMVAFIVLSVMLPMLQLSDIKRR